MIAKIDLGELAIEVVKKDIKNIHLSVYPPTGRVRVSAPLRMNLETIRVFAISKLGWIKQQQEKLRGQQRETRREYLNRESHYVWGKRYLLQVIESGAAPGVELKHKKILLRVRPGTSEDRRQAIVDEWYREQLKSIVPSLIAKWEPLMGVSVARLFVQKMKTKWGSCNPRSKSIRLNTELTKKPPECLEYILVHEMLHLIARRHDEHFISLMERYLPNWKSIRQTLNEAPLAHANWAYD
jgi:predicted metal-dependent hydrolase